MKKNPSYLKRRRVEESVHGLSDVSSVEVVVIWHVLQVVVLQGQQEPHEGQLAHLESLEEAALLEQRIRSTFLSQRLKQGLLMHSSSYAKQLHTESKYSTMNAD